MRRVGCFVFGAVVGAGLIRAALRPDPRVELRPAARAIRDGEHIPVLVGRGGSGSDDLRSRLTQLAAAFLSVTHRGHFGPAEMCRAAHCIDAREHVKLAQRSVC